MLMALMILAFLTLSPDLCPIGGLPFSVQAWPIFFLPRNSCTEREMAPWCSARPDEPVPANPVL